jgi:hypothetical protein
MPNPPRYLEPYLAAARRHGGGFGSLLWASPATQEARFDAIARACDFRGKSVLDAGCGRADLLDFFINRGIDLHHYVGLEAVDLLAEAAREKRRPDCIIVQADFVTEPSRLFAAADVVVFSGSLNTLDEAGFYQTLCTAFEASAGAMVFNFLDAPHLAAAEYLTWHPVQKVVAFVGALPGAREVRVIDDYLEGDCTVGVEKAG